MARKPKVEPNRQRVLAAGEEAWALVDKPVGRSTERRQLEGAALVRVLEVDTTTDLYVVEVTCGSGVRIGRQLTYRRAALYARADKEEHAAFGREVARFWGAAKGSEISPG